jgi:hypothetical protein
MSKNIDEAKACSVCGTALSGVDESCPVCMLRKALADGVESVESSFGEAVKPTPELSAQRFEHYELVKGEDGKPVELGRGAMGVTYKAIDVDLRCAVTLKLISEKYLGDESTRLRFLRVKRRENGQSKETHSLRVNKTILPRSEPAISVHWQSKNHFQRSHHIASAAVLRSLTGSFESGSIDAALKAISSGVARRIPRRATGF